MYLTIRERLVQAEDVFLSALGNPPMKDFHHIWNALAADIHEATNAGQMSQEDLVLADLVSTRISVLSQSFEEFFEVCDAISLSFEQDIEKIFEERDCHPQTSSLRHCHELFHLHTTSAPYIYQTYIWLLQNLSNPYPPKEVRERIARETGSHLKHVEGWFVDVRKRMGWNAIRKRHFLNKRHLVVNAAKAFFENEPSELLTDAVRQDFSAMVAVVEEMYFKKFNNGKLVRKVEQPLPDPPSDNVETQASVEAMGVSRPDARSSLCGTGATDHQSLSASTPSTSQSTSQKRSRPSDTDMSPVTEHRKKRSRYILTPCLYKWLTSISVLD